MKKLLVVAVLMMSCSSVFASIELAKAKNCMACHTVQTKLVGPSFKDVAARYKPTDEAKLVKKVMKGGSGNWGVIPMPANAQLNEKEAQDLVKWILTIK